MGAINNAFNQAAGAVAGAGLAIKHAKETDFSKAITAENAALIARNQAREADVAAKDAKLEEQPTTEDLVDALIGSWGKDEAYYKAAARKNASAKTVHKKLTEWQAAQRSIDELDNKLFGIKSMQQRAEEQRAHADKATELSEKAQQKYRSRWGGMRSWLQNFQI